MSRNKRSPLERAAGRASARPPASAAPPLRRRAAASACASRTWTTSGRRTRRARAIVRAKASRCASRGEKS